MAAGDYAKHGTGTVSTSGPGVIAAVTVTDASVSATDDIFIHPTNTVTDTKGNFSYKVVAAAGSFTVTMDRPQLPSDFTFNWMAFNTA